MQKKLEIAAELGEKLAFAFDLGVSLFRMRFPVLSGLSKTVGGLARFAANLNPEKRACKRQMMLASVCGRFALCDPLLL